MTARPDDRFPTTQWDIIVRASHANPAIRREAIGKLVALYAKPIRRFVASRRGVRTDEVDDIVHDFLTLKWLEQDFLARAAPEKGRFRWFLSVSLGRYVTNWLRESAYRRGNREDVILENLGTLDESLDDFDKAWAKLVLDQAIERFRSECGRTGRSDLQDVFEGRVLKPCLEHAPPVQYEALVKRHNLRSPAQASNLLMTAKRTFLRSLREVMATYDGDESNIDAELMDLLVILRKR